MSASRVLPSWRPIHDCGQRTLSGACPQPNAFDDPKGRCYWHKKLEDMPGILNGYDSRVTYRGPGNQSGRARPRYPYATWFDGQPHTLVQGTDFLGDMRSMQTILRRASVRLRCDIAVSRCGATITVQAQPKSEAGAA